MIKHPQNPVVKYPMVKLPEGYKIEKYADGLTFPTSLTWDNEGNMFVAEAEEDWNQKDMQLFAFFR